MSRSYTTLHVVGIARDGKYNISGHKGDGVGPPKSTQSL